jgi:hypothetical protein
MSPQTRGDSKLPDPDDHISRETRALSAFIVPFLVTAFIILYFLPTQTGTLFAWPIAPPMTSFLLASAYIGGAYFFVRVILERRWHRVSIGFLPVTTFASLMFVATLLHWDRFSHGNIAFWAWASIYAITPLLVLGTWLRNRSADPGTADARDAPIPLALRWALGILGAIVLTVGIFLFAAPGVLVTVWPWSLTPLTARVIGSCFALTGTFGLTIVGDHRWTSARIALQSQALGVTLILVGSARAWGEFDSGKLVTWLFVGGLAAMLVAIVAAYFTLERRMRAATR